MAVVYPTILPHPPIFPRLMPRPPRPHPIPLPNNTDVYEQMYFMRDLPREMDDLSEEEVEFEDLNMAIHNRGFNFLVPIGRTLTQQEEKNDDADDDDGESEVSSHSQAPSEEDEEEENSVTDMDASMEDLDEDEEDEDEEDLDDQLDEPM